MTKAPVLVVFYNRPELLRDTWSVVRHYQPDKLFLAGDGPKTGDLKDARLVAEARAVVESVDWPCEVLRKYSPHNLGCRVGPASAFSWTFEHTDKAIILEDDLIVEPSFFSYCAELLDRYESDPSVMVICGYNPWVTLDQAEYSYDFSHYPHPSGWATWKRAWDKYDINHPYKWSEVAAAVKRMSTRSEVRRFWKWVCTDGPATAWDYQWMLTCLLNDGKCIVPACNLVSHRGFGESATHTKVWQEPAITYPMELPLKHRQALTYFLEYERAIEYVHFSRCWRVVLAEVKRHFRQFLTRL